MEVTRKNFKETLPLVALSIKKADFLAIDTEFTGLMKGRDVSIFDSPEAYYNTVLNGASEFLLIQFGLCAFYWDEEVKHYRNDAYNFYLFPRGRSERMFLCQSSSLDFLASQGFDFNKLIREGISYLSEPAETKARDLLIEKQKLFTSEQVPITIPDEHKQNIEETCKRVQQFLDEKKADEMEIDRCNNFVRKLLFQELGTRFKNEVFLETRVLENQTRVLKVTRITSEDDRKNLDSVKFEKEWDELEDTVGFTKVARMISQSDKLVIGHNMLLDLMHTLNHFFQPLPQDYTVFKEFAHCMFPSLLDTKYMSSLPPFKEKVNSSVLQHLLATLSEPPFSLPNAESKEGRGYRTAEDKQHEAGYDAYVTGLCFLAMHSHLSRMRGEPQARAHAHSAALKPFLNKVFLAKTAHQDIPYMNLSGADPSPPRDHIFHLTFPKDWNRNDINMLFSPYCAVQMQFIDDTSAFVALTRREQARDVVRGLASNGRVTLVPYARYRQPIMATKEEEPKREYSAVQSAYPPDTSPKKRLVITRSVTKVMMPEKIERVERVERVDRVDLAELAETLTRVRSKSVGERETPPAPSGARKRTSSGVFQVDEAEPPSKKIELPRSNSESNTRKKSKEIPNGRRKTSETDAGVQETTKRTVVIEKFDSKAVSNCVTAFKESDNWD